MLTKEGIQLYEKIVQLNFKTNDGKVYVTNCLKTSNILRLRQSFPSSKSEPFKLWITSVHENMLGKENTHE